MSVVGGWEGERGERGGTEEWMIDLRHTILSSCKIQNTYEKLLGTVGK